MYVNSSITTSDSASTPPVDTRRFVRVLACSIVQMATFTSFVNRPELSSPENCLHPARPSASDRRKALTFSRAMATYLERETW